jgi:FKBP-type peptidyl-prolyl cis-trans isomerase
VLTPGLAYGAEGTDAVPPNTVLVYDLVLLRIVR